MRSSVRAWWSAAGVDTRALSASQVRRRSLGECPRALSWCGIHGITVDGRKWFAWRTQKAVVGLVSLQQPISGGACGQKQLEHHASGARDDSS